MSHEFESGFFVRDRAWHGLGTVLEEAPTTDRALELAGLDWEVTLQPVYAQIDIEGMGELEIPCETHKAVVREKDGNFEPLAVVGNKYTPVQNSEAFRWFDPLVHEGDCTLDAAGSLRGGRNVWVLAKLTGQTQEVTKGDPVNPYLLLSNSHDGSRAVTVAFTPIRVVCWNTLSAAHADGDRKDGLTKQIKVKHTANVGQALAAVRSTIDLVRGEFSLSLQQWRAMQAKSLGIVGLENYIRQTMNADAVISAAMNAQEGIPAPRCEDRIVELFENGPGAKLAGHTVYGAYMAVTHYLDHEKGRTHDAGLMSTWFGESAKIRERAHSKAVALI